MADIIGEVFEEYVQNQIYARQLVLGKSYRTPDEIAYSLNKTAFIRLTSGIDISESKLEELGFKDKNLLNAGLARYLTLSNQSFKGSTSSPITYTQGVGYSPSSSYGFGITDATTTELNNLTSYGYVPPPGITSADVKSKNRGSLREATVQISCHNLQQFKIIETLFLRLKFSVLLEWGHSVYYDSTDKNNPVLVSNDKNLSNWFLKSHSQQEILNKIEDYRKESFGNYDAFFGFVKNFSWTLKPDGGYEITVSLVTMGDVIESLKANVSHPSSGTNLITDPSLEYAPTYYAQKDRSTLNKILYGITSQLVGPGYAHGYSGGVGSYTALHTENLRWIGGLKGYNYRKDTPDNKKGPYLQDNEGLFYLFPYLSNGEGGAQGEIGRQYYIKLGTLLRIVEGFLMYYNTDRDDKEPIVYIDYNFNDNYCLTLPRQVSTDPTVCLIPLDKTLLPSSTTTTPPTSTPTPTPTPTPPASQPAVRVETTYWAWVIRQEGDGAGLITDTDWYYFEDWVSDTQEEWKSLYPGTFDRLVGTENETRTDYNATNFSQVKFDHIDEYYLPVSEVLNSYASGKDLGSNAIQITNNKKRYDWKNDVSPQPNTKYITEISYADQIPEEKRRDNFVYNDQIAGKLKIKVVEFVTADAALTSTIAPETVSSKNVLLNFDKGYRSAKGWKGRHMHIHLNIDYIARTLQDNIDVETGKLSLYNFLTKLMHGVQNALGNINNFEVIYNERRNELRIIDNTVIPGLVGRNKLTPINPNILTPNYGSFVYDINIKTELSKAFATMVTVGAQSNGNVVGENATALSRWNRGLKDRHFSSKQNVNSPKKSTSSTTNTITSTTNTTNAANTVTGTLNSNIPQVNITAVAATTAVNLNNINQQAQFVGQKLEEEKEAKAIADQEFTPEETYDLKIALLNLYLQRVNDGLVSDGDVEQLSQSIQDLLQLDLGQLTNKGKIPGIGFIPFNMQLTLDGLSGPKIYQTYTIDTRLLPENYNNKIQFITKGVSHKIDSSGWTTVLDSLTSPKYQDFNVEDPPSVSWDVKETVVVVDNGGGGPLGGANEDGNGTEATLIQNVKYHGPNQSFVNEKGKTFFYTQKLYEPRGGDPTAIVLHYNAGWGRDTSGTFFTLEKRSNEGGYPLMCHFGVDRAGNYDQYIPWEGWGTHLQSEKLSKWGIGYEISSTGPLEAIDANTIRTLKNNLTFDKYRRNLGKTADEPIGWPVGKIPTTTYDYQTQCVDFNGNPLDQWRGSKYWCRFTTKEIDTVKKLIQEHSKKFNIPIIFRSQADWDRLFKDDKKWITEQTKNLPAKPSGLYTHSSITWSGGTAWKTDINPDPDLIAMLKSISQ